MRLHRTLIGMVHLAPLPGSPRWAGSMDAVVGRALDDAQALADNGIDTLLIENFNDVPFVPGRVEAATVAAMTVAADAVRRAVPTLPLGVNVLRSDGRSALAIACAVGAEFIRVNVHTGAVLADQGILQTDAHATLRDRRLLGSDVKIFADVQPKHSVPLGPSDLEQDAHDLVDRALADALVVTGRATGLPTALGDVKRVRSGLPGVPVLVGSGTTPETVSELLAVADGVIVGTALKRDGDVRNSVDPERVRRLVAAARER
jgi:membrane complex biogenesis BtpA family protein